MKGVFFKEQLEFRLEVKGDEWRQGDTLSCSLSVRNRSTTKQQLSGLYLHLAQATVKSVREKANDAFHVICSAQIDSVADIEPGVEQNFPWTFELDKNCTISEKTQSLYLICGRQSLADFAGQLAVTVLPHPHIEAVLSLLETSFAFVLKGQKSKKDWVEAKLKPPSGKEYPTLEHLLLSFHFDAETLRMKYCFNLKTIQASATTLTVGKAKREIEQQFHQSKYLFPGGLVNNQPLESAITEALAVVKSKM